jgi:hypothetical protein
MSAINPASFVTPPTAGLQGSPTAVGGALYGQDADSRHQHAARPYPGAREDVGREGMANPVGMLRSAYPDTYPAFSQQSRQTDVPATDPFGPYSPGGFGTLDQGFPDYHVGGVGSNSAARMVPGQGEWVGRFQGLSLNSS